jgi:regulator of protease activity HflC (stomatin/prohibitin superfamily)
MKRYSDYEINILIDELTEAALEAIEQAAGEAAKAAALAMLEREAAALQEAAYQQAEALRWRLQTEEMKKAGVKNVVISGLVCLAGGLIAGFVMSR